MDFAACLQWTEQAELIELRLDLLEPLSPEQMRAVTTSGCQWIATCRPGQMDDEARFACLAQAMLCGATFIDVEHDADESYRAALMHTAKQFSCNVIVSYHNPSETPDAKTLQAVVRDCFHRGADYVKVVTQVQRESDVETLMGLYNRFDQLSAFGMGDFGRVSRIQAAPHAVFTYVAPDAGHLTASGQLTWQEAAELHLDEQDE